MRLSKSALGKTSVGQVVNLISNDVNQFDMIVSGMLSILSGPLKTFVVTYFLWQEVGVSSIVGVTALLMFIPLQGQYEILIEYKNQIINNFLLCCTFIIKVGWERKLQNSDQRQLL